MIKINLIAEKKQARSRAPVAFKTDSSGVGQNVLLVAVVLMGFVVAGGWWWKLNGEITTWEQKHVEADRELKRLEEIRRKGEEYKKQKELLARKIDLITQLKRQQAVPVHILDQISRNLPDFLWLESMSADNQSIAIKGKATNYNSVSNFYSNLTGSGFFDQVTLGRTFEVPEGVAFSLNCHFAISAEPEAGSEADQAQG